MHTDFGDTMKGFYETSDKKLEKIKAIIEMCE